MYVYIYIYIYIERCVYIYIYIYIYTHTYTAPARPAGRPGGRAPGWPFGGGLGRESNMFQTCLRCVNLFILSPFCFSFWGGRESIMWLFSDSEEYF